MKHSRIMVFTLVALSLLVGPVGTQVARADSQKVQAPKAKSTTLLRMPLAGVEGMDVIIKRFEFPANFVGGKHWHPGPVFVYVLEGELTIETDNGLQTLKAREVCAETPKLAMRAKNLSATGALKTVAFLIEKSKMPFKVKVK